MTPGGGSSATEACEVDGAFDRSSLDEPSRPGPAVTCRLAEARLGRRDAPELLGALLPCRPPPASFVPRGRRRPRRCPSGRTLRLEQRVDTRHLRMRRIRRPGPLRHPLGRFLLRRRLGQLGVGLHAPATFRAGVEFGCRASPTSLRISSRAAARAGWSGSAVLQVPPRR